MISTAYDARSVVRFPHPRKPISYPPTHFVKTASQNGKDVQGIFSYFVKQKAGNVKTPSAPPEIQRHVQSMGHFVQTDRATHEAWAKLAVKKPSASAVLHYLAANVGQHNAVIMSQKFIAKALGVSDRTVRTAISDLAAGNWVQVVRIGAGREAAYVLNSRAAWADKRDNLRYSRFSAEVIADADDQTTETLEGPPLHKIPVMFKGEQQLPSGDGLPPPSEPSLPGFEHELPALRRDE